MSAVEGGMFLALYLAYVLVVVHFERVLILLGMPPLAGAPDLLALLVHKYKYWHFERVLTLSGIVARRCTQFTCFTSTNVQMLTFREGLDIAGRRCTQFTCFTSTKVQILTQKAAQVAGRDCL
jgi:hypothetical protein